MLDPKVIEANYNRVEELAGEAPRLHRGAGTPPSDHPQSVPALPGERSLESTGMIRSTAEAAELLGVDEGTLRYWRYLDTGPKSFRLGRRVKYRLEHLREWIADQEEKTGRGGIVQ